MTHNRAYYDIAVKWASELADLQAKKAAREAAQKAYWATYDRLASALRQERLAELDDDSIPF
jgi:hypothetical protein